jgi:hypothetical protein
MIPMGDVLDLNGMSFLKFHGIYQWNIGSRIEYIGFEKG